MGAEFFYAGGRTDWHEEAKSLTAILQTRLKTVLRPSGFCIFPMHNVPETGSAVVLTVKGEEACVLYTEDGRKFSFRNVVFQSGAFAHSQKATISFVTSLKSVPQSSCISLGPNGRRDTRWRKLRRCVGSIPDGVIGFFYWDNLSGRTMALGLTQPLTEKSTRNISRGVKAAGA